MPKLSVKRHAVTQPLDQSYRLIPLTQEKNAVVDVKDFEWLSQWNWHAYWDSHTKGFYAGRRGVGKPIRMHAFILGCKCDHKNHDTLDNRRDNLRRCTSSQNAMNRRKRSDNTSGYKGVQRLGKKWCVHVTVNRRQRHIGMFSSLEEDARAYDAAAKKYHGEFANLNFPNV